MKMIFTPIPIPFIMPVFKKQSEINKLTYTKEDIFDLVNVGNIKAVYSCINEGTSVNSKNCKGQSLLHYAIYHNQIDIAKLLIFLGGDIYYMDKEGKKVIDIISELHYDSVLLDSKTVTEFSQNFIMYLEETTYVDTLGTSNDGCCLM
jgi:hypothetical protein